MESVDRTYVAGDVTMEFTEVPGPSDHQQAPVFLLVHGIGMGRIVFGEVAPILAARGRVLAPDLPGFGDSPEPGSTTTIEDTAANLIAFAEAQGATRLVLVGHSMGTQIVTQMAVDRPDLVHGLVLIAPTVNRYERTATKQAERMLQDLKGEGAKVLLTGVYEYFKTSPLWFAHKLKFMLAHHIEKLCPLVTIPVLVLRGETDKVSPRDWTQEVADAFPHGRMEEVPGRGHEAIIESPEPVATMVLEYVASLS